MDLNEISSTALS